MRNCIIIFFLCISISTFSQSDRLVPIIDSVTVIDNQTFFSWTFEDNPEYQLSGFKIYKAFGDSETDFAPLIDVDSLTFTFTDITSTPDQNKERYRIAAYSATLDSLSPSSDFHQSVFLEIEYDSCQENILLRWNPYVNWENGTSHYQIYSKLESEDFVILSSNIQDTFLNYTEFERNNNYSFYVRAVSIDGQTSTSNHTDVFTNVPNNPAFLDFEHISVEAGNILKLEFDVDVTADIVQYGLYKSEFMDNNFEIIDSFPHDSETDNFEYTDNFNTSRDVYYYFVQAINTCNIPIIISDTLNNILVELETDENNLVLLNWNNTNNYISEQYKLYRSINNASFELINELTDFSYSDNILQDNSIEINGNICYLVEANRSNSEINNKSNTICLSQNPEITAPSAFSPNGDGKNDLFKPEISASSISNYTFVVMNRWGEVLFKTNVLSSPEGAWNGEYNGNKVQQGTYIYYLKFNTAQGNTVEQSGNISVYYP